METTTPIKTVLAFHDLELPVELGYSDEERSRKQIVLVNVEIAFDQPPHACITDNLLDTFDYASIINTIHMKMVTKNFRLLEHLTYEIYQVIKNILTVQATIQVRVTKQPVIPGLRKGASFTYKDGD